MSRILFDHVLVLQFDQYVTLDHFLTIMKPNWASVIAVALLAFITMLSFVAVSHAALLLGSVAITALDAMLPFAFVYPTVHHTCAPTHS